MALQIVEDDIFLDVKMENAVALDTNNIPFPSIIRRTSKIIKLESTTLRLRTLFLPLKNENGNNILVDSNDVSSVFNMHPETRYLVKQSYLPSPNVCKGFYYPTNISTTEYNFIFVSPGFLKVQNKEDLSFLKIVDPIKLFLGFGKPNDDSNAFIIKSTFVESLNLEPNDILPFLDTMSNPIQAIQNTENAIDYIVNTLGLIQPNPKLTPVFKSYKDLNPFKPNQLLLK